MRYGVDTGLSRARHSIDASSTLQHRLSHPLRAGSKFPLFSLVKTAPSDVDASGSETRDPGITGRVGVRTRGLITPGARSPNCGDDTWLSRLVATLWGSSGNSGYVRDPCQTLLSASTDLEGQAATVAASTRTSKRSKEVGIAHLD